MGLLDSCVSFWRSSLLFFVSSAPDQATFVSDAVAGQPRFRLAYRLNGDGTLAIAFAIAPPDADSAELATASRVR